jgi:hypothetical protein
MINPYSLEKCPFPNCHLLDISEQPSKSFQGPVENIAITTMSESELKEKIETLIKQLFPENIQTQLIPLVDQIVQLVYPYITATTTTTVEKYLVDNIRPEVYNYTRSNMTTNLIMNVIKNIIHNKLTNKN